MRNGFTTVFTLATVQIDHMELIKAGAFLEASVGPLFDFGGQVGGLVEGLSELFGGDEQVVEDVLALHLGRLRALDGAQQLQRLQVFHGLEGDEPVELLHGAGAHLFGVLAEGHLEVARLALVDLVDVLDGQQQLQLQHRQALQLLRLGVARLRRARRRHVLDAEERVAVRQLARRREQHVLQQPVAVAEVEELLQRRLHAALLRQVVDRLVPAAHVHRLEARPHLYLQIPGDKVSYYFQQDLKVIKWYPWFEFQGNATIFFNTKGNFKWCILASLSTTFFYRKYSRKILNSANWWLVFLTCRRLLNVCT